MTEGLPYGGVDVVAPPLPGRALFDQDWLDLFFLHWALDPDDVAPHLPRGTRPDVFEGATYVGLVPFRMVRAGLGRRHPTPYLGTFLEWNVRLYSVDDHGRHGVVFASLEATRFITAMAARYGYHLPYTWSRMHVRQRGRRWTWSSVRRYPRPDVRAVLIAEAGDPIEPTPLEVFLTARWGLHSSLLGRTVWTPNEHGPWPLHAAHIHHLESELAPAAGIGAVGMGAVGMGAVGKGAVGMGALGMPDLRPLYSPGVHTTFGFPVSVA